ncbi:hypothetical protein TNCV_98361 [Trichonephila clavipes]|nr:hypothetical protein TNCV_98361 [Trichonephila clavipes]
MSADGVRSGIIWRCFRTFEMARVESRYCRRQNSTANELSGSRFYESLLKYRQYLNSRTASTAFMIRSLVGHFKELGSVADCPGRGAYRNILTEEIVETVLQRSYPSVSNRNRSS